MTSTPDRVSSRLTAADREAALVRVKVAFIGGVVPHEEMDARLQSVLTALTSGELAAVLTDLPEAPADAEARGHLEYGRLTIWHARR